jgi:hypothetical protein
VDLENARAEVADLRAQLATLDQGASARESQEAKDASIGESVHEHTRDLCLILGFLITRVEDALATPWGFVEGAKHADDDVPELIRRISSRAGPRNPAAPDAGTDWTPPGLCDATSEAVAALHSVINLISKMKEMSKEEHHTSELYSIVKDELQIVEDSRGQLKVGLTCLVQPSLAPKT